MDDLASRFIVHLMGLGDGEPPPNRAAMADLRRSLAFEPGMHKDSFRWVERFAVGLQRPSQVAALYVTAGLYALHRPSKTDETLAKALGRLARHAEATGGSSDAVERRFAALVSASGPAVLPHLRHAVHLVAAATTETLPIDHAQLLRDIEVWLRDPPDLDRRDAVVRRWAREFYAALHPVPLRQPDALGDSASDPSP